MEVNESRYIALFVVWGSIKKLFSIDCVNIYFSHSIDFAKFIFSQYFYPGVKCGITPLCLYLHSLTLKTLVNKLAHGANSAFKRFDSDGLKLNKNKLNPIISGYIFQTFSAKKGLNKVWETVRNRWYGLIVKMSCSLRVHHKLYSSNRTEVFYKRCVLDIFAKLTGKDLRRRLSSTAVFVGILINF